jgi:hypothetical protein
VNVGGLVDWETPAETIMDRAVNNGTVTSDGIFESYGWSFSKVLRGVVNFDVLKDGWTLSLAEFSGIDVVIISVTGDDLCAPWFNIFSLDFDVSRKDEYFTSDVPTVVFWWCAIGITPMVMVKFGV